MDYKYIEQLLERYFAGETSLQEERILCAFFEQDVLPAHLAEMKPLFAWKDAARADEQLGDDFDARLLAMIGEAAGEPTPNTHHPSPNTQHPSPTKARTISMSQRLAPLFRAAAVVAIILTLGQAMRFSMKSQPQGADEINYADYKDTYEDPAVAYDKVEDALLLMSEGLNMAQTSDSLMQALRSQADSIRTE